MSWTSPRNPSNHAASGLQAHVAEMERKMDQSFYPIFDRHHDRIRKFIVMTVRDEWAADDLTQETFFRAYRKMPTLEDHSKMSSWLFRIAWRLCLDHFRAAGKLPEKDILAYEDRKSSDAPVVENELERGEMSICVQNQVLRLPETYRTVLWLFDVLGFSLSEIAEILDITLENVKIRLHRARKKLKSILMENCMFERDDRNVFVCIPQGEITNSKKQITNSK